MIQILQALQLVCEQNFTLDTVNQQCTCLNFLSANRLKCVISCEELGETLFDGRCVKAIGLKSAASNDDCMALYNHGSIWDGVSGCICDNANGYAGSPNSSCVCCIDIHMIISQDNMSCISCESQFGFGSIFSPTGSSIGTCKCDKWEGFIGDTNTICTRCWDIFKIVSPDGMQCVTCEQEFGVGTIFSLHQCECDNIQGFAGQPPNDLCMNCWAVGKEIQGTICVSCAGNQVLQEHQCKDCPVNTVPSQDQLSCVTKGYTSNEDCMLLFNQGSIWDGATGCKCDNDLGFVGPPNTICIDCWKLGQEVSGNSCAFCTGNKILLEKVCQECPANKVVSPDMLSCVPCYVKYGPGSIFVNIGNCNCDNANGYSGINNNDCVDCWRQGKIVINNQCSPCDPDKIFQNGLCINCPYGLLPDQDLRSCISCNMKFGVGSIFQNDQCSCDNANDFASLSNNQACVDCLRNDSIVKQFCSVTCKAKEKWDSALQKCVCDSEAGYGGVRGACCCDIAKGYTGTDSCVNCWASAKMATASGCVDCPANEIITPGSKTQCGCDSAQGYAGVSGSCSCSAPGFALTLGACVNCAQNGQIVSASGCVACPSSEKFDPSAKACVCDSTLGFVGVSGSCFCNFGAGLSQTVTGSVKSCGCNQQAGSVLDGAAPSLSCKCDATTGHAGQLGACFCDSSTGHFGYPGFCMCNFNLQFVGSAGSCKNCAALNAHASQINGAYFCRCNGDSGYGSPDASGTCRLCASANSVVQVDSQGQFQCVACAATEKVVKNMCVGA
ncbi:Hypothetical_protein [Hexamita inflata]|uniref:Hypothetical_protein n=1 Tax=Hexamita inflata TaxID=28002 RepID=A0AA86NS75_9EUKA|nr:Hypothetical protein HINF_LOCUS12715 [Hexamita inflata]